MNQPKQATMREKKSIALLRAALCISAIALPARAEPPRLSTMHAANLPVVLPSSASLATSMGKTAENVDVRITKLVGLKRKCATSSSGSGLASQTDHRDLRSNPADWLDAALQSRKQVNDVRIVATTPANASNSRVAMAANTFEPAQLALVSAPAQGIAANAPAKIAVPQAGAAIAALDTEPDAHAAPKLDGTEPDQQSLLDIDMDDLGPPLSSVDDQTDSSSLMTTSDETASNESTGNEPARLKVASIGASSGAPRPLLQVQVGNVAVTAETCRLTDKDSQSSFVQLANPVMGNDSPHIGTYKLSDQTEKSPELGTDHNQNDNRADSINSSSGESESSTDSAASSIAILSSGGDNGQSQSIETPALTASEPLVELVEQAPNVETNGGDVQAGDADSLLTIPVQTPVPVETDTPEFEVLVEKKQPSSPIVREAPPTNAINRVLRDGTESHSAFAGLIGQITDSTPRENVEIPTRASKSLELPGTIIDFAVENMTFCQAMKVNGSSITLIGLRIGQTRLAVRFEDAAGNTALRVYLLSIFNSNNSNISDVELAQELAKTVKSLYPASKLDVVTERGSLVVRGTAASEDEAQSVLTLVRRTTLRPVVDRLTTRR